ncbi:YciI family protein [Chryseobacterium luteum]|uniref:GTP cyclohydrolase n=1 Tax=Chryseobacterium luteum TaxID=421531 RepID=A0A085ZHN1_9FLAO|nr:YciI family protein [Chryseobacterium luteum]KFF03945.1 GTP cyclohydrolase [Chryseobacterium luteum]
MFIISLTYKTSLENVERFIPEHNDFLEKHYQSGNFIASGRKEPRTGGIILADAISKKEVEEIIQEDPFYIHQVADYTITEFIPSKYNEHFKFFIKNL